MEGAKDILPLVFKYARERWAWDDESMLAELYADHWQDGDTVESFVDQLAIDYDLLDPRDYR